MRAKLFQQSLITLDVYPVAAKDWDYDSGVLTAELFDDLYWVSDSQQNRSPSNVTSEDWVQGVRWLFDLKSEGVSRMERLGSHTFRAFLDEDRRLDQSIRHGTLAALQTGVNFAFWREYIERIQDASTEEQREQIRIEASERPVNDPDPVTNMPFRVVETTDSGWRLRLRNDEDSSPRWVTDITFDSVEIVVEPELSVETGEFRDGRVPFAGMRPTTQIPYLPEFDHAVVDPDVRFDTRIIQLPRNISPASYVFNIHRHPTDNVHFRRAIAYLLDREAHHTRFMEGDRVLTGFHRRVDEERWIPGPFFESLADGPHDNYGYDEVKRSTAEAELVAGGFERNSANAWLDHSGEPIRVEILTFAGMERLTERSQSFAATLTDFGIDASVRPPADITSELALAEYTIAVVPWGGRFPHDVYHRAFETPAANFGPAMGSQSLPDPWEGPPVGTFATPPHVATEETETFPIGELIGGLPRLSGNALDESVRRLAWIYNQSLTRLPIGARPYLWAVNTESWNWPVPIDANPSTWGGLPWDTLWQRGLVEAVPSGGE